MPKQVLATECCSYTSRYKATVSRWEAPTSMDIVMEGVGCVRADTTEIRRIICLRKHSSSWLNLLNWFLVGLEEDAKCIDGYKNFWCHRKNRIGSGVGILTSEKLAVTQLTSHTTCTFSAGWILLHPATDLLSDCRMRLPSTKCWQQYHPWLSIWYDAETSAKTPKCPFHLTGDLSHLPITNLIEQCNLKNLVNFNTHSVQHSSWSDAGL